MSQYLNFGGHFENGRPKICSALYLEVPTRSFFHLYPSDDESTEKPCSQNYGHGGPDIQYTINSRLFEFNPFNESNFTFL